MTEQSLTHEKFRTGSTPLTGSVSYLVQVPYSVEYLAEVADALNLMTIDENWQQSGTLTPHECAQAAIAMMKGFRPMIGTIFAVATADVPDNCLPCFGFTYHRVDYPALYDVLASAFIVDADHFITPDLREKMVMGAWVTHQMGTSGGEATHLLTTAEIPAHSHTDTGHNHTIPSTVTFLALTGEEPVVVPVPLVPSFTGTSSANLANTGGGGAHNNLPPFQALGYVIVAK